MQTRFLTERIYCEKLMIFIWQKSAKTEYWDLSSRKFELNLMTFKKKEKNELKIMNKKLKVKRQKKGANKKTEKMKGKKKRKKKKKYKK